MDISDVILDFGDVLALIAQLFFEKLGKYYQNIQIGFGNDITMKNGALNVN